MIDMVKKVIFWLFAILLFLVPIILWPFTSEVFEFNKMVLTYALTTLIVGVWAIRSINERKFIFRRTILDKPLLIFLASQFISSILSIDPLTSWLGYYSRFNGGFVSTLCYSLLYWAFVSNFEKDDVIKLINYAFLPGAAIVSLYGVFEHFGIDKNIWVQDVQSRVFSSLGQPNWLASWLIALMPISWALLLKSKFKSGNFWASLILSILFFWTTIFTKSRSGYLGLAAAFIIFWGLYFRDRKKEIYKSLIPFGIVAAVFVLICAISGTEYTPSIGQLIKKSVSPPPQTAQSGATSLDTGGTESGTIRRIVWKGAVQIWLHYPVFGTGVETFAFSYYKFRPVEHNLTSEWDFIYNKAHNEFLNMAANSGTVGLVSYLAVIGFSAYLIYVSAEKSGEFKLLGYSLLAGYLSLWVTNFFGFSVVPTQLELFLFPAFALVLTKENKESNAKEKLTNVQKISALFILGAAFYILFMIAGYWQADTLYAKGTAYYENQRPDVAAGYLTKAANLEPGQPLYWAGPHALSDSYASLAVAAFHSKEATASAQLTNAALNDSQKAADLSPANINLKRVRFGLFITLTALNPNYLINARDTLLDALNYAPTDPKLYYNLGLVYARISQPDLAITTFQKTIELKSNYAEPRLALAYLLIDKKDYAGARTQLTYILKNIDPKNSLAQQALDGLPSK